MAIKCLFCGQDVSNDQDFCSLGCRDEHERDLAAEAAMMEDSHAQQFDIDDEWLLTEDEDDFDPEPEEDGEPDDVNTDFGYDPYIGGPEQDEPIDVYDSGDDLPW